MYKVFYYLPSNFVREIIMDGRELTCWLKHRWLRERIVNIVKVH